ncbi:hypothetical protein PTTG_07018 [Puccinia triticina 1-1 BBBD Race 1]|uniref:Uncharacterized protein n=1 Tax=Puccinia triticina (isolate 1-1 / race 1 (BBBD)) TaxID=630390 RepID=A0A180GRV4_PUCT1|nr:hypothetical protein PTTG_07018 [Puccinia triticina 1-1 BBBD Race 1]
MAAPTSNRQELANPHPSATSTGEEVDANLTIQHSTGLSPATNTPLPPSTAPQDHPSQSLSAKISLAGPPITPVDPSKIPPVPKPPAPPMITLLKSTTKTGSTSDSPTASHEKSSPATSKPSDQLNPISFIRDETVRGKVHSILKTFHRNLNFWSSPNLPTKYG